MTSVIVVAKAAKQLQEIDAWWREHRPRAETLVIEEFERCVELLENTPAVGAPFRKTSVLGVRRLVMKRTRHLVYYVHDLSHAVVYVIAVWGMPKEGLPQLDDPR